MEIEEEEKREDEVSGNDKVQINCFLFYLAASSIVKPWNEWKTLRMEFVNTIGRNCVKMQQTDIPENEFTIKAKPEGGLTDREKSVFIHA